MRGAWCRVGHTNAACLRVAACSHPRPGPARGFRVPLPLPAALPPLAGHLREQFVEDTMDYFLFLVTQCENADIDAALLDSLLTFLIAFTSNLNVVRSPHLRAKFGDVIFQIFLPDAARHEQRSAVSRAVAARADMLLRSHSGAHKFLAPSMSRLYGDVEQCGFEEKLVHR